MKRFEYFDHTADVMFRAYGKDFEGALSNAVLAVYNVITDTERVASKVERSFTVSSSRRESLVYDVFEELLFLLDTEGFLCREVSSLSVAEKDGSLEASVTLLGDADISSYEVEGDIKAPTYHEMLLGEEDGVFFIQAVLDI
ncbi:archease [Candidatus Woesearchaeota archaeon]|nr:archease [Candidatus Woesearchaeota archaeon]